MSGFLGLLFLLALIGLIVGLFKPKRVLFWGDPEKRTRKRSSLYYGIAALILVIFGAMTSNNSPTTTPTTAPASTNATPTKKAVANDAKKKADAQAKADAEAKAAADAKAKADAQAKADAAAKAAALTKQTAALQHSGTSDTVTNPFTLNQGIVVFNGSYTGDNNFSVELLDSQGSEVNLLVNTIGNYKGKTLAYIPSDGQYILKITGQGNWSFNGTQQVPTDAPSAPTTLSGKGDDVQFVRLNPGLVKFTSSHDGQSNFVVMGNGQTVIVNEIGKYSGQTAEQVQNSGIYAISVQADGNWTIKIQ